MNRSIRTNLWAKGPILALSVLLLGGCRSPIGVTPASTRQAYAQVQANALSKGHPSSDTAGILHRYGLDRLAASHPDEAVRQLHQKVLDTGDRDLLFALAELSYLAGDHLRHNVKPWDQRDARDFYLGSAVYAWLFLFGDGEDPKPSPFDARFREACNLYNYSLGLALTGKGAKGAVQLVDSRRPLPVGELDLRITPVNFHFPLEEFDRFLLADQFLVRGLSVRNREPGIGVPLICVGRASLGFDLHQCSPATVLLRAPKSLADLNSGQVVSLELYSAFDNPVVTIGETRVPLETDLTAHRAYAMNDPLVWRLGKLGFLSPAARLRNQLILHEPYDPKRIPVVFVHGTFSSPVTWAEMANSLEADPVLRERYQFWSFLYGSGNPLVQSIADLRSALTTQVQHFDPSGTNVDLHRMVVIGHSQGGLLAKGTAIRSDDQIWRTFSTNRLENIDVTDAERAKLRRLFFLEPLPFVRRVVFVATPHRGSYLAVGFARRFARRLISLPGNLVARGSDLLSLAEGSKSGQFLGKRMPTSLDNMSPKSPGLLAMAEIPVVPEIKAHSIIPVQGEGPLEKGSDGVVTYQSAHVDYVESELVVRSKHSCLNNPATIEEVRRILHEHLGQLDSTNGTRIKAISR